VFREVRSRPCQRWSAALRLQAAAQLGAAGRADADAALADLRANRRGPDGVRRLDCEVAIAEAWHAAAYGDPAAARAILTAAMRDALADGATGAAVTTGYELIRMGVRAEPLRGLEIPADWRFGRLVLDFDAALGDGTALDAVATRFAADGMALAAAEAAALAADAHATAGAPRRAATSRQNSARFAESCQGARTPALAAPPESATHRLSRREYEIAVLAARGASSRAIADSLVLSPRTVENHLNRAYAKLGISGRADLGTLLDG
jgi:DNA-binding CsgD family transcriptional regulator